MSKNQIIKDTREVGKTTYLYNLVIQAINDGMNVIVLDSATEHEDKSLLKKVAKKYPEAKVIELREESKVATYEELNKGLTIFDFPYFDIKNNQSNILCIDLSYFLEKGHEVFDATQDKEEYDKYRNLYRRVSQQILMTLITLDAKGMLPNTIVVTDEIEFPTIDFDPTLFQKDLTIISSVHPENAFGTYYQNCSPANFVPYKVRGDSHVLK